MDFFILKVPIVGEAICLPFPTVGVMEMGEFT